MVKMIQSSPGRTRVIHVEPDRAEIGHQQQACQAPNLITFHTKDAIQAAILSKVIYAVGPRQ